MTKLNTIKAVDGYEQLEGVLARAYIQASCGKGAERHASGEPFHDQPMQTISALVGSNDGLRFQAVKKIHESARLDKAAAVRELLGAINYIAGAIIYIEGKDEATERPMLRRESDKAFFGSNSHRPPNPPPPPPPRKNTEQRFDELAKPSRPAPPMPAMQTPAAAVAGSESIGEFKPPLTTERLAQLSKLIHNGWTVWTGGNLPLPDDNIVDVIYRDGEIMRNIPVKRRRWSHHGDVGDIIAYFRHPTCNCGMLPADACVHGVSCNDG